MCVPHVLCHSFYHLVTGPTPWSAQFECALLHTLMMVSRFVGIIFRLALVGVHCTNTIHSDLCSRSIPQSPVSPPRCPTFVSTDLIYFRPVLVLLPEQYLLVLINSIRPNRPSHSVRLYAEWSISPFSISLHSSDYFVCVCVFLVCKAFIVE